MDLRNLADMDAIAVAVRLGLALFAGALIGLDRELKRKPAGLRTHALVSVGSAIVILATGGATQHADDAMSRAVQGIITGIGFIGAGVIIQHEAERRVEGLTTAASIFVAAALGIACGAGLVELVLIALGISLLVLIGGDVVERLMETPKK